MAVKKVAKTKAKPKNANPARAVAVQTGDYQSVDVRKADNGYVISAYSSRGKSKTFVAKDKAEMQGITKKLLGIA